MFVCILFENSLVAWAPGHSVGVLELCGPVYVCLVHMLQIVQLSSLRLCKKMLSNNAPWIRFTKDLTNIYHSK